MSQIGSIKSEEYGLTVAPSYLLESHSSSKFHWTSCRWHQLLLHLGAPNAVASSDQRYHEAWQHPKVKRTWLWHCAICRRTLDEASSHWAASLQASFAERVPNEEYTGLPQPPRLFQTKGDQSRHSEKRFGWASAAIRPNSGRQSSRTKTALDQEGDLIDGRETESLRE